MKISLDKKILAGFIACSLILLVISLVSYRNSERLVDTNQWINHTQEVLSEFDQILLTSVDASTGVRGFIITRNEEFLEPFSNAKLVSQMHLDKARELTIDNPVQQKNIEQLSELQKQYFQYLETNIELTKNDPEKAVELVKNKTGKRIMDEIRAEVDESKSIEQKLLTQRKDINDREIRNFNTAFVFLLIVIIAVLGVLYFIITFNIKALRKAEADAASKNWRLAGSTELAASVMGNMGIKELSRVIINHIVKYLDIPLGAIYITEKDRTSLKLNGYCGLDQTDRKDISFGEGIVGQAASEKRIILLHDIKPMHFNLHSSFGQIRPKNILAIPLLYDNSVISVLELGSLTDFSSAQREYVEFVSGSIVISILSAQVREEAGQLLEETQRQSEELTVQQDELKQTNEELHAKTELLEQSETELRAQQTQLQQVNVELEEKANMLEEQKRVLEDAKGEIEMKAVEVETTSKYKSEFLANMSHELRTPLNSILILSQLLSENKHKSLNEKDIEYARNIHHSGADLLNLINEILDLSKIEAGKMQLEIAEISVRSVTDHLSGVFSEVARNSEIDFQCHINKLFADGHLITDKQRLEQILKNLLSNAFKFTRKGGKVILTIDRAEGVRLGNSVPASCIIFSVSDSGIGIAKEKLDIIFEAFRQADGTTKRKYGGTGLGLSISRELARALGGDIRVESEQGEGSVFTLYLPVQFDSSLINSPGKEVEFKLPVPAPEKEYQHATSINDDRSTINSTDKVVLIIEDDEPFASVLLDFVRERNYKGVIATQGNTGVSFARHYKPVAIILDLNLPVMGGIEVLKLIKSDPELRHVPVQIISAYDEKKQGLQLGAFDFLKKPVLPEQLRKAFDKIESFKNRRLKKLLIVEDNELQNNAIRELIGNGDVKCLSAFLGTQAYEILHKEAIDCMIVDLGLPDMTGFELLEKIKSHEQLSKIPVIVYTGRDLKKDETDRLNRLADTVVLKTASSHERLFDETTLFLHRVEAGLPKEKQELIRKLHNTDEILKGKKILLVDDDIRNIYSLTNALEVAQVICFTAENGRVALEVLRKESSVDLVLMDIMMPEMDGYEATMEIRKMEKFINLPIIALTAKAMKGDKEKCLAAGMSDYISKPVNVDQLLSLMRVWLYRS